MKFDAQSRISGENIREAPSWFLNGLLIPLNQFMEQVARNLRLIPEQYSIQLNFSHGIEREVANPGFTVSHAYATYAEGQAPILKWRRLESGKIGLTVYFYSGAGTNIACKIRLES